MNQEYSLINSIVKVGSVRDYIQLTKPRLTLLVIMSSVVVYIWALTDAANFVNVFLLGLGGFMVAGSANALNQIIEREHDKNMHRTKERPLAADRLSPMPAFIFAAILAIIGGAILWFVFNPLTALLALFSLVMYAVIYTPLKRISNLAVFVGAIPGAVPPLLGYLAATGTFTTAAWFLFCVQFLWQFPHFWAIAWKLDEDYKRAGFNLLPSGYKDKKSAFQILLYSFSLIPISFMPLWLNFGGNILVVSLLLMGIMMFVLSVAHYKQLASKTALRVMFASFIYLPVVLAGLLLDKFL
ncbi:MAG: protoheme IX farnesyltransferase [Bacteroidia bacterium]|nr:protoheme IX farnesyltransferase [Bacteroidia bacterium]